MEMGLASQTLLGGLDYEAWRVQQVWEKGWVIPGREHEAHLWRMDDYGYTLFRWDYGNASSAWGWELDHHPIPKALGGSDLTSNLRPLYCSMNRRLGGLLGAALDR
jgi:hypothetical protein